MTTNLLKHVSNVKKKRVLSLSKSLKFGKQLCMIFEFISYPKFLASYQPFIAIRVYSVHSLKDRCLPS